MKTNKNTKKENTRLISIIRRLALVALSGVATLNILNAGDPENNVIKEPDNETNYLSNIRTKRIANSEDTFIITDFNKEHKGSPVDFKFDLLEYRLQLALEEEPEPEMEIEDWMIDLSYWKKLFKVKLVAVHNNGR